MSGNGILHHSISWNCGPGTEGETKAKAIRDFADHLYYTNLFSEQEESCDAPPTPSPTSSLQPSASMQPTYTPAPDCADMVTSGGVKLEGEQVIRTSDHFRQDYNTINDGRKRFQIDRNCIFNIRNTDWSDTVRYGIDIAAWLDAVGEMVWGTQRIENGASLVPETPPSNNIIYEECGTKWCTIIKSGPGVTGDYTWETDTSTRARQFRDFLRSRANSDPEIFLTKMDGSLTCGSMPFCYDDKTRTTCYIDHNSENCGAFDFMVAGDERYVENGLFRTGDVMEFFKECTNSFGCTVVNPDASTFLYHNNVSRKTYFHTQTQKWRFELYGSSAFSGGGKDLIWECPSYEAATGMKELASKCCPCRRYCVLLVNNHLLVLTLCLFSSASSCDVRCKPLVVQFQMH